MRGERIDQEPCGVAFRVLTAVICVVAALGIAPGRVEARVVGATVPVRGMTCALCTRSVEESVKGLGGVRVTADVSAGLVRVEALEGRSVGLRDVKDRILAAGFKIGGESELEAIGRFILTGDGRITFRVNAGASYLVLENDTLRRIFRQHPRLPGEFQVAFRLHDHPEYRPPAIALSRFVARHPPAPGASSAPASTP
jgi:copper chaperone CopZ